MSRLERALLVCPTLNPGDMFVDWLDAFHKQKEKPAAALIIDSSSDDDLVDKAKQSGFNINVIQREKFSHGGTRQKAVDENEGFDYIIFLTQDAILYDSQSLKALLSAFDDSEVAAVCGRQLPRENAGQVEAHARFYSYPDTSNIRSLRDVERLGIKAAFLSNSFAAYRRDALLKVGGFPSDVIFGEDMFVAAKLLKAGYKIAYAADACVYHSHNYSLLQEFRRYFDMGVFHSRNPWIRQEFGTAEGEGVRFVRSELHFMLKRAFWKIPEALLRVVLGYTGFRLGLLERWMPARVKCFLSMNRGYFG